VKLVVNLTNIAIRTGSARINEASRSGHQHDQKAAQTPQPEATTAGPIVRYIEQSMQDVNFVFISWLRHDKQSPRWP
jgi:hypothetical protein